MSEDKVVTFNNTNELTITPPIPGADWYEFTVKDGNIIHVDLSKFNERMNSHQLLVEALEAIRDKAKYRRDMHTCNWIYEQTEAALKAARGE